MEDNAEMGSGLMWVQVVAKGFYEQGNETLGFAKKCKFLDQPTCC
jgi:hypothetical protein